VTATSYPVACHCRRHIRKINILNWGDGQSILMAKSSKTIPPEAPGWHRVAPRWVWVKTRRQRKWRLTPLRSVFRAMDLIRIHLTSEAAVERLVRG
jgi:hypothetical protein